MYISKNNRGWQQRVYFHYDTWWSLLHWRSYDSIWSIIWNDFLYCALLVGADRYPDGSFEFLGRSDNSIKVTGSDGVLQRLVQMEAIEAAVTEFGNGELVTKAYAVSKTMVWFKYMPRGIIFNMQAPWSTKEGLCVLGLLLIVQLNQVKWTDKVKLTITKASATSHLKSSINILPSSTLTHGSYIKLTYKWEETLKCSLFSQVCQVYMHMISGTIISIEQTHRCPTWTFYTKYRCLYVAIL